MKKFKEFELTENLKDFQEKTKIEIEFDISINAKLILEGATVKYDSKNGFIDIEGENAKFRINTTLVYGYGIENDEIHIDLETLLIKIKKSM